MRPVTVFSDPGPSSVRGRLDLTLAEGVGELAGDAVALAALACPLTGEAMCRMRG